MVLIFLAIHGLSSVPFLEEIGLEGPIEDFSVDFCVTKPLVTDDLEKRGATTAWTTKNQNHLARFGDTLKVLQNIELSALFSEAKEVACGFKHIEKGNERIGESLGEC